jgi:hypothetical protein
MTKKELLARIETYPDDTEVLISFNDGDEDLTVNIAEVKFEDDEIILVEEC